ncbi:hypothetical protein G6F56_006164 [Rhizopus delemar]|nr:hypothetical protein G6F56_006164 [Rhizopus delemar]
MGKSLDTLNPEESFLDQEEAVGLKAYARDFKVDLHSKRNRGSGKRSFHEAILMMNDMDLRLVKALVDKTLIEKKTSLTESEYYVGSAATKVADDCHWEDVEDYVLLEPSSMEYRAIEVYPFVFSPLICFKRHDEDNRREYLKMTHDCIMDTKIDARDFQKSYLYCRASDLQRQIEELDKHLDMINKALNVCNYIGYHELKRQHEQISFQIESLRKNHLLLNEYICQVVLEKELTDVTSAFGDPLSDFKDRCFLHSPQIIWNTSVRDILLYWNELKETRAVQAFSLSEQCLQLLSTLLSESQSSKHEGHSKPYDIFESTFENHEAKSNVLVDAFYPQIVFQSDAEHLLLVTNERMQVQILDLLDDQHFLVKNRCMLSLEDGHIFIAANNNEERCYGQMDSKKHWATWIYPEQLWKQVSKNYTKITSDLSGKAQLDVYNPLRIKRYPYAEIASTVLRLDFPELKWTANSLEARLVYLTLVDLLLNQKLTKEKLMQETLLLSAERSDLTEFIREFEELQRLSRHFIQMHSIFLKRQSHLDSLGQEQYVDNKQRMQNCLQRLNLVVNVIKSIQNLKKEMDTSFKLVFNSNEVVWEALKEDAPLCRWVLKNLKFAFLHKSNGAKSNVLKVEQIRIVDTSENPVFVCVLEGSDQQKQILSLTLDTLPPVGGITVIKQLQINVSPLHLQLSTDFGDSLKEYFFPTVAKNTSVERNAKEEEYDDFDSLELVFDEISEIKNKSKRQSIKSVELLAKLMKNLRPKPNQKPKLDELTKMKHRLSKNRTFIHIQISESDHHLISLKGPSKKTFYNIQDFPFKQPKLEYKNKTWSMTKLIKELQKGRAHV